MTQDPKQENKNEVVEAVRERVRMADAWAKSTGYPPADYFDTMMDLRRLLAQFDALSGVPEPEESLAELVAKGRNLKMCFEVHGPKAVCLRENALPEFLEALAPFLAGKETGK